MKLTQETFFEVLRLVSLGDALGFGCDGGTLEYSAEPFAEALFKELGSDVLHVALTPDRFPISDDSITTHLTLLALLRTLQHHQQQQQELQPHRFATTFAHRLLRLLVDLQDVRDPVERSWGRMMFELWKRFPTSGPCSAAGDATAPAFRFPARDLPLTQVTPFDGKAGGNGGAMHAAPIGLLFHQHISSSARERQFLIATAVESGRVTHNHPVGFLGSVAAAYFTACAAEGVLPVEAWPTTLLHVILPETRDYLHSTGTFLAEYEEGFSYFEAKWRSFIQDLEGSRGRLECSGAAAHRMIQKQAFGYSEGNWWSGSSGHDVGMYGIYALLACQGNYRSFIDVACNHPGDSDTTGAVALPLYGLVFGLGQIPPHHVDHLERSTMLKELADAAFGAFSNLAPAPSSEPHL